MTSHFDHIHHYNYFSLSAKDKAELMETISQSYPIEPIIKDKFESFVSWGKIKIGKDYVGEMIWPVKHKHYSMGHNQLSYHSMGKAIDFDGKEIYLGKPIDYVPVNADLYETANTAQSLSIATMRLPGVHYLISHCPVHSGNDPTSWLVCPNETSLRQMLIHLNDIHQWTREQIADWLETIHDPTGANGPNLNFEVKEMANG